MRGISPNDFDMGNVGLYLLIPSGEKGEYSFK
jgi:hypothetical protein